MHPEVNFTIPDCILYKQHFDEHLWKKPYFKLYFYYFENYPQSIPTSGSPKYFNSVLGYIGCIDFLLSGLENLNQF